MSSTHIRETTARTITPLMQTGLAAMARGELEHTAEGWRSTVGEEGNWNTHTIKWLASREYCRINGKLAAITRYGRDTLIGLQGWAA